MTPIEEYEAQQRAFEEERYNRLMRTEPARFVYEPEDEPATLSEWLIRILFAVVMAGLFLAAGLWIVS